MFVDTDLGPTHKVTAMLNKYKYTKGNRYIEKVQLHTRYMLHKKSTTKHKVKSITSHKVTASSKKYNYTQSNWYVEKV